MYVVYSTPFKCTESRALLIAISDSISSRPIDALGRFLIMFNFRKAFYRHTLEYGTRLMQLCTLCMHYQSKNENYRRRKHNGYDIRFLCNQSRLCFDESRKSDDIKTI